MITLQINDSGSWRTILKFEPERRAEILGAVANFASVLGSGTKWCLLHEGGGREWLRQSLTPWQPITATEPAPLNDVMVSVFVPGDEEPVVFMAYRKADGQFYLSGTPDEVLRGAFAYAPVMEPAAVRMAQQAAA